MQRKLKVLFISDHPLVPSGIGTQSKLLIEGLLATGRYQFRCLGGAMKHPDTRPQKVAPEKYGDDWIIFPVNGYGDKQIVRQMLMTERPDVLLFFTDPRFYVWLWEMEDEVRSICPMIYWHVWDNDPAPRFNKNFYESTDHVSALSLKTFGLLQNLGYERKNYIPHAVDPEIFKPLPEEESQHYRRTHFGPHADKKFILFWNNRNARRKVTGDVIETFAKFAKAVGQDKVSLMMHTAIHDPEGQDVLAVAQNCGIDKELIISEKHLPPQELNSFYNACDCTINLASNEGFGLGTLESMMAGTPIVVHMTGGLQYQIGDWWKDVKDFKNQDELTALAKKMWRDQKGNWWGAPVFTASRSCTGSQQIPYIYDDRVNHDDVVSALKRVYEMGRPGRKALGLRAREWANQSFNMQKMITDWDQTIQDTLKAYGKSGTRAPRLVTL